MKKTMALLVAGLLVVGLSGCNSSNSTPDSTTTSVQTDEAIVTSDSASEIADNEATSNEQTSIPETSAIQELPPSAPIVVSQPQTLESSSNYDNPIDYNVTSEPQAENTDTEYVKTPEEAAWVCYEYRKAIEQNVYNVQTVLDQYDAQIYSLQDQITRNSTQEMVELRQIENRYSGMGMLDSGAYKAAVEGVQNRYANVYDQLSNRISQLKKERDAYESEHNTFQYALQYMAQNTGLSYEEVNALCFIYIDEIKANV